jgi:hypothetical protein
MTDSTDTTYMGMALVGGNAGQFKIGDDGATHITLSGIGETNGIHVDIDDANTVTSGYVQGYYVAIDTSSGTAWSTGNTQANSFGTDITLTKGTVACEVSGMYVYISGSSNATISSALLSGLTVQMADVGSSPSSQFGVLVHWASPDVASSREAAFYVKGESACACNALLGAGNELPTYFFHCGAWTGGMVDTSSRAAATATKSLKCYVSGTAYYIPLLSAT